MRRFLALSFSFLLLLICSAGVAFAADAAGAEIPVEIDGGGTAYMIPEVNSPLPTEHELCVDNGRTGRFYIAFTEPGEYHYTIKAAFSEPGGEAAAEETFRVTVTVLARADGTLETIVVITSSASAEKQTLIRFRKPTAPAPTTPGTPVTPGTPGTPGKPGTPNTGDESHLTRYLLIATASAAGLFCLAVLYTFNTNKLIKKEETD